MRPKARSWQIGCFSSRVKIKGKQTHQRETEKVQTHLLRFLEEEVGKAALGKGPKVQQTAGRPACVQPP